MTLVSDALVLAPVKADVLADSRALDAGFCCACADSVHLMPIQKLMYLLTQMRCAC